MGSGHRPHRPDPPQPCPQRADGAAGRAAAGPDDAIRILDGPEYDPLRRAFPETLRRTAGRGPDGGTAARPGEEVAGTCGRGDVGATRTIPDRGVDEAEQRSLARGPEQGFERHRTTLLRQAARRFGDGTAADLTEVLRGLNDPKRLTDVSELVFDCATGGELLAGARRIAGRE